MMWRWLATLWLAFVVARYATTSYNSLLKPINAGWEFEWFVAWIAMLLAVAVSLLLFKSRAAAWFWLILTAVVVGVILLSSGTAAPAASAAVLLAVAAGFGEWLLGRFHVEQTTMVQRLVVTTAIGLGALALLQFGLGLLGLFSTRASWALMVLLAWPATAGLRNVLRMPLERGWSRHAMAAVPLCFIFVLNLSWATAPEIQYDAVNVHLAVPKLYLQSGAIVDLPYFFHSYFAHLGDMLFGIALALGGSFAPKFLQLGLSVLATSGIFTLGRKLFGEEAGIWAALIFYSTPLVIWSAATAYVDIPETAFVVACAVAFVQWIEGNNRGWLLAGGWIAGAAAGTKIVALAILAPFAVAAGWRLSRSRGWTALRILAASVGLLLVVMLPWYVLVYAQTGNPVFPYLNGIFQSPQWPLENTLSDSQHFGVGTSPRALLRLPFRLTFETTGFGGLLRGSVGFALLLLVPFGLRFLKGRFIERCLLAAVAAHMVCWTLSFQYGRYYLPALPFVAVLGAAVFVAERSLLSVNRVLPALRCSGTDAGGVRTVLEYRGALSDRQGAWQGVGGAVPVAYDFGLSREPVPQHRGAARTKSARRRRGSAALLCQRRPVHARRDRPRQAAIQPSRPDRQGTGRSARPPRFCLHTRDASGAENAVSVESLAAA